MKSRFVFWVVIAVIGLAIFGFGIYGMTGWQQAASSGNMSSQASAMFGTGVIGIVIIVIGLAVMVGGAVLAWQAYENRYD